MSALNANPWAFIRDAFNEQLAGITPPDRPAENVTSSERNVACTPVRYLPPTGNQEL